MSNIGYAVFGSPKGIAVESNGLFKNLNLDKSLYLNSSHIVLDKGEQVLMIRRIPSNLNNLEKKDALLVVLYENALQYGENRPGGFVGSAICFKDQMPNAEKMMSGLFFLFQKIKENVDADNRFKAIDSSNWNITLPDPNKDFGLEDNKLNFAPFSSTSKNVVIKLNSLEKDAKSVLYNFALNQLFHSVDYLYASKNNTVVEKIKVNNFSPLPIAELFNYNKQLSFYKERLDRANEKFNDIKKEAVVIQNKIKSRNTEVKRLDTDISFKANEVEKIEKEISEARNDLTKVLNNTKEAQREFDELLRLGNGNSNSSNYKITPNQNEDIKKINELNNIIKTAARTIEENSKTNFRESQNGDEFNRSKWIVEDYFKHLEKRKTVNRNKIIGWFAILLVVLLTFAGLFTWKTINFSKYLQETDVEVNSLKKKIDDLNKSTENIEKELEYLDALRNVEKGSVNFDPLRFKELAAVLLNEHLDNKTSSVEKKYINERKWEFYEFDYNNNKLVEKLDPKSKDTYFMILDKEIKALSPYLVWKGEDKIDVLFKDYTRESNDIYQNLDEEVLNDSNVIEAHFKWMIEKENGKIDDLKKGEKIKLPFLKI